MDHLFLAAMGKNKEKNPLSFKSIEGEGKSIFSIIKKRFKTYKFLLKSSKMYRIFLKK